MILRMVRQRLVFAVPRINRTYGRYIDIMGRPHHLASHDGFAGPVGVGYFGYLGNGGLLAEKPVGKAFLVIIAASELLMIVQSTVGGYFFLGLGMRPGSWVQHLLYGGLSLFTLPTVVYSIRNEVDQRRVARIWAFTCLFMFGLTFRTATTGVMGG